MKYSNCSFQKLEKIAEAQGKIINAIHTRLDDLYDFLEQKENTYFKGADMLDYLQKLTDKYPIIIGKE